MRGGRIAVTTAIEVDSSGKWFINWLRVESTMADFRIICVIWSRAFMRKKGTH